MCKLQTVSFVKLAQGFEGQATYESSHRRVQRFFAEFLIERRLLARLIFALLPSKPPYRLSMVQKTVHTHPGKTAISVHFFIS
ncbi:hypothetical protein [Alkaliflexus imshenetskii]|uniref:hypothetical protein n=1 Tax=Alkaliflexus imshenetskii TaxID=286730 RepID=UPI0012FC17A6|nr:hypothetical protein [Alkaliflexus imshenetskii]